MVSYVRAFKKSSRIGMKKKTKPADEQFALAAIGAHGLKPVKPVSVEDLLSKPVYSSLAYEVYRRRGSQTSFQHIVAWPMTHWWDLQDWMNQTHYELEQLFGPVVHLVNTQQQTHAGKVHLLAFFEIGPISPLVSPLKVGMAWRQFLRTIGED